MTSLRPWAIAPLLAVLACAAPPATAPSATTLEGTRQEPDPEVSNSPFMSDRVVELRLEMPEETWQQLRAEALEERYYPADLIYDGQRLEQVALRPKGNSSLRSVAESDSDRLAFKIDTDHYIDGQELLGVDKLNLSNGFKDPTLLREHLAYAIARGFGLAAPRTGFVDLWIADRHLGLYTLVEQVDGEFLRDRFGEDAGALYKPEPPAGWLIELGADFVAYESKGMEVQRDGDDPAHAALLQLIAALRTGTPQQWDAVLDLDQALRYLAFDTALVNLDSYLGIGHNYYLYARQGRFTIIPWDLNEAFGNFTCGCDRDGVVHLLIDEPTCARLLERPLVGRLLSDATTRARYHEHLRALLDGPLETATFNAALEQAAALIRPYVAEDPTLFFSLADFETGLRDDVRGPMGMAIGLETFIAERGAAMRAQLDGQAAAAGDGSGSCGQGTPPGGGPGTQPCGDGICDAVEQANPDLCPGDC